MSQAFATRLLRVFACLADSIQWIQSIRAMVVVVFHTASACGFALSAARKSAGSMGSGSLSTGEMLSKTLSPTPTPDAVGSASPTLIQWLSCPSGSSVAQKKCPLKVPSILVRPRLGSFSLIDLGKTKNAHQSRPPNVAGRSSLALKLN